jgi:polysaccharide export outer membrane protein
MLAGKELMMRVGPLLVLVVGCFLVLLPIIGEAQTGEEVYWIKPGDVLRISVWGEPELQDTVLVTPDGTFSFPLVGHVNAEEKTAAELQEIVSQRLKKFISEPAVSVALQEIHGNAIYVLGQVNSPGVFVLTRAVDVMQALSMAGGATPFAALNDILILRRGESGQVALPFRYSEVSKGRNLTQNIRLESGDVLVVP